MSRPFLILAACAVLALPGCLLPGDQVQPAAHTQAECANGSASGASPPDAGCGATINATGSDVAPPSIVTNETNKTVAGFGGQAHSHDYWLGRTRVIVWDGQLSSGYGFPVFPNGQPGTPIFEADLQLPPGHLVYEGTGQAELLVSQLDNTVTGVSVAVKTAGDSAFRDPQVMKPGTPLVINVKPIDCDMPHATNSLWSFRFFASGANPALIGSFHFTLTIVRERNVQLYPGHPDFYGGKPFRVVLDKDAATKQVALTDAFLYGQGASAVAATRLVSMGTDHLVVFTNVSKSTSPFGPAVGFFLEYHNATGNWTRISDSPNASKANERFLVPVSPDGLDSPYAQASRWEFRLLGVFASTPGGVGPSIGLCPGCFNYEIDYHIQVIAYPMKDPQGGMTG
ncbi:MAG: hypothetical protein ACYDDF_07825 [Thermoplasmatota archaeon]